MTNKIALHIFLIALMIFLFYLGKCDEKLFGTKLISQIAEFGLIIFISSFIFFTPWGNNITEQKEYIDVIPEQNKYYNYEKRGNIISYFNPKQNRIKECKVDIEDIKIYKDSDSPYIEIKTSRCLLNLEHFNEIIECNIHLPKNK